MILDLLQRLRQFDHDRPGIPGEHLFAAFAGVALLRSALRSRSTVVRALAVGAGAAMLYRAASGRDGLARLVDQRTAPAAANDAPPPTP